MQLSAGLVAAFQQKHLVSFGEAISAEFAEAELLSLAELVKITQQKNQIFTKEYYYGKQSTIKKPNRPDSRHTT